MLKSLRLYSAAASKYSASRGFSFSAALLKKKPSSSAAPSDDTGSRGFDAAQMRKLLDDSLKQFGEKIKEAKSNTLSTDKFSQLNVDLGHGATSPLKSLATIAARGNKINIVAFDPKQVKRIQTAIVSQLGMPAEPSDKDQQTVSVTIPQQSESNKSATAKLVKEAYESFRNNSANKHSIASIRAKFLNPVKKAATKTSGVSKDDIKKQTAEIEQIVKDYSTKLMDQFKKSS